MLDASDWIDTPPLTPASLKGKVVLVDFWDASCINCRRTFPFLSALQATYKSTGARHPRRAQPRVRVREDRRPTSRREAKELGVTWPVANDPNMTIWNAFGNQYWPAQYLVDRTGKVRLAHEGEGDDTTTGERRPRSCSNRTAAAPGRPASATCRPPRSRRPAASTETPETYLGAERGGDLHLPAALS